MNSQALASARSFLFVPGNRPERFLKAIDSGADAVDGVTVSVDDAAALRADTERAVRRCSSTAR